MEPTNLSVLDRILAAFTAMADLGVQNITPQVMWLFFSLGTIAFVWQHIKNMASEKSHPVGLLFSQLIVIGFFVWILGQYTYLTNSFYLSMVKLGLIAGGLGHIPPEKFGNPSSILKIGFDAAKPLVDAMGYKGWFTGTNFILAFSVILIFIGFFVMSFQVFIAILEFKLGLVFCFFMMAFALLKQTSFATEKAFGYIFASGMRLFGIATITSIGTATISSFLVYGESPTYTQALSVAGASLFLGLLTWFIPAKIAGVVSGGPVLGASSVAATVAAYGALLGGGVTAATAGANAVGAGASAAAAAAKTYGVTDAIGETLKSGASNLANSKAGRVTMAAATIAASKAQGMAEAAMPSGPTGRALRSAGGAIQQAGGKVAQSFREAGKRPANPSESKASNSELSPEIKSNPLAAVHAMENINSIERRHDAAKEANGGVASPKAMGDRANRHRELANEIANVIEEKNPQLASKMLAEVERVDKALISTAGNGASYKNVAPEAAEQYKGITTRALNLDGGGGFDKGQITSTMSPDAQMQNAKAISDIGVGPEIRALAAKGMGTRDIVNSLGDKLKPIDVQASRIGQAGRSSELKLQAISDFKTVSGIPNKTDTGFKEWARQERQATMVARTPQSVAPEWAKNVRPLRVPNIRAFVPNGTERSGGITASGSTPDL